MYTARLFDDTGHLKTEVMFAVLENAYAALDNLLELEDAVTEGWTFELLVTNPTPFDHGEYEVDRVVL